jgi:hypothetical protein
MISCKNEVLRVFTIDINLQDTIINNHLQNEESHYHRCQEQSLTNGFCHLQDNILKLSIIKNDVILKENVKQNI